eukprot:3880304-Pyramimonas_sp.AAC.1
MALINRIAVFMALVSTATADYPCGDMVLQATAVCGASQSDCSEDVCCMDGTAAPTAAPTPAPPTYAPTPAPPTYAPTPAPPTYAPTSMPTAAPTP